LRWSVLSTKSGINFASLPVEYLDDAKRPQRRKAGQAQGRGMADKKAVGLLRDRATSAHRFCSPFKKRGRSSIVCAYQISRYGEVFASPPFSQPSYSLDPAGQGLLKPLMTVSKFAAVKVQSRSACAFARQRLQANFIRGVPDDGKCPGFSRRVRMPHSIAPRRKAWRRLTILSLGLFEIQCCAERVQKSVKPNVIARRKNLSVDDCNRRELIVKRVKLLAYKN